MSSKSVEVLTVTGTAHQPNPQQSTNCAGFGRACFCAARYTSGSLIWEFTRQTLQLLQPPNLLPLPQTESSVTPPGHAVPIQSWLRGSYGLLQWQPSAASARRAPSRTTIRTRTSRSPRLPMTGYPACASVLRPTCWLRRRGTTRCVHEYMPSLGWKFNCPSMPLQVQVRCWEIQANGTSVPKAAHAHDQPVLASGWNADGSCVFSGGCDKTVKMWNLATNQQQVSRHTQGARHGKLS